MAQIGPQDTYDHFIGSGALSYSWWWLDAMHGTEDLDVAEGWSVTVREYDPDTDRVGNAVTVFDHKTMSKAVNTLARTALDKRPKSMGEHVIRECRAFIADPEDADFDADAADQVMQYVAFGEVVYG